MNIKKMLFGPSAEERVNKIEEEIKETEKVINHLQSLKVPTRRLNVHEEQTVFNTSYPRTRKVSVFEKEKPNKLIRVIDDIKKTVGEKPEVSFDTLVHYKNKTPQIDTIIGFETDMIVGTDLNINADDEEAKTLLETMSKDIDLYNKIRNHTTTSLTTGFGLMLRVPGIKGLDNIEEYDITAIREAIRDEFGNTLAYTQDVGDYKRENIKVTPEHIQLIFKRNGRSAFGLSEFHGLAVRRGVGNRITRPLIEAFWSLDDVTIGTLENFAYPVEYHVYEGANDDDLQLEAQKLHDQKPGDRFVISRPHQIDRREPTQARFDSYINHFKDLLQQGTGFPLDMLTGDFTSRASSQTADTFFMRKIKSYQKYLVKLIKKEILEYHLMLLGWPEQRIENANVTIEFEVDSQAQYTPQDILSRVSAGLWSKAEGREYDKGNGQDLFDDEKVEQEDELNKQMDLGLKQKALNDDKTAKDEKKKLKESKDLKSEYNKQVLDYLRKLNQEDNDALK